MELPVFKFNPIEVLCLTILLEKWEGINDGSNYERVLKHLKQKLIDHDKEIWKIKTEFYSKQYGMPLKEDFDGTNRLT